MVHFPVLAYQLQESSLPKEIIPGHIGRLGNVHKLGKKTPVLRVPICSGDLDQPKDTTFGGYI